MSGSRRVIALALFVAALGALGASLWLRHSRQTGQVAGATISREPASILLITLDTTRTDRLQPYGAEEVKTPTLQNLADHGVVFESTFAVAPITLPAHTSILTGLYPPQHGVRNNGTHYVPDDVTTLAEQLAEEGFRTAAFVSAAVLEKRYGLDQGFELYDDDLSAGRERHPRMVPDRPAESTVASATDWLDTLDENELFFAWVHCYDPHAPYSPPPPFRDEYRGRLYDGEVAYLDAQLGRLLDHPRITPNTIVVVMGDHGESLGEHGEETHGLLAYDATMQVPWILRFTGAPAGARVRQEVDQVDLMPTLLDLLGLECGPQCAGQSVLPLLERSTPWQRRLLYSESYLPHYTYGWAKLQLLRSANWKFIAAPTPELYDLKRDPSELSNQHDHQPGIAHDLTQSLGSFMDEIGGKDRETSMALDSETAEKLRSLGYLAVGSGSGGEREDRPDPKDVIDLHVGLERARQLDRDRLFDQAEHQLRAVLDRDSGNLAALLDLAGVLQRSGKIDEALDAAETALALDPDYPRIHLLMAGLEAKAGNVAKALELVGTALSLDPGFVEARIQEIHILRQARRIADARQRAGSVLGDYPDNPRVLLVHAQTVDIPTGDLATAEKRLTDALARDPFLVPAWRALGQVQELLNRLSEAQATYREGLGREPDDADLHAALGLLLARHGDSQAPYHLREAIRLSVDFRPDLHVALGAWLAQNGRLDQAQQEYERVLEVEPQNPAARNNRAIAYYYSGRMQEAEAELQRIASEFPNHPDAHNNLAAVAIDRGDWAAAERHCRKALESAPEAPQTLNNLGIAQDEQGQVQEALISYQKALESDPLYWQARHNLGVCLRKLHREEEAAQELNAVLQQIPGHPESHLELGELYAGPLANPNKARSHLNAFIRYAPPGHPLLPTARQLLQNLPPAGSASQASR